jgi:threonine dehydrogenase-like Zn-dependent dehydrogenase
MGHEFTGEVVERGKNVKSFSIGDKVVSPFTTACGSCFYCKLGLSARCDQNQIYGWKEKGKGLEGAQAEFIRVPLADTTLIDYRAFDLKSEEAIIAGDIMSTGYFGAKLCMIKSKDIVTVVGCGPVGLLAAFSALQIGAAKVYCIDTVDYRLNAAAHFGAVPIKLNSFTIQHIRDATQGRGADAVIEAVGNESAQQLAFDLVRPGGIISTIGVHTTNHFTFKPADVYNKNITYSSGRCPARSLMPEILPMIAQHKKILPFIFTHKMKLSDGVKAYNIFDKREDNCIKIILVP